MLYTGISVSVQRHTSSTRFYLIYGLDGDATGEDAGEQAGGQDEAKGKDVERLLRENVRECRNIVVDPLNNLHVALAGLGHP